MRENQNFRALIDGYQSGTLGLSSPMSRGLQHHDWSAASNADRLYAVNDLRPM